MTGLVFGDPETLAFEVERSVEIDGWAFIHFRIWVGRIPFGNFDDDAPLKVVVERLTSFLLFMGQRCEAELDQLPADEVYRRLFDSIAITYEPGMSLADIPDEGDAEPPYRQILARFHLHEVGDSALFGEANLLLMETADGHERVISRDLKTLQTRDTWLPGGSLERAAKPFLIWADRGGSS